MNPLQRALIEKTGHDFGFEYVYSSSDSEITLASALHPVRAKVFMIENDYLVEIVQGSPLINLEMARSFTASLDNIFQCHDIDQLAHLLKRMASLGKSLPNQAEHDFDAAVKKELELLPAGVRGTEIERMVRQRIGQQTYRKAMLEY
ncbi:MAG: hypothetical protein H8E09_00060 [Gammaproteobacteria bacterium]|nr:hypothetical protein [Gammaproteobacteria bacterium]